MTFVAHIKKIAQHNYAHCWGIFFLVTLVLYWRTLSFGFFSDDFHMLHVFSQNSNIFSYFVTNIIGEKQGGSYGPVFNAVFILQYLAFGVQAFWYHMVMILLHATNGLLVYIFAQKLFRHAKISFLSALCFLLFQSHVGSISWVSVLPHVATTLFILATLIAYLCFLETKKMGWYVSAFFLSFFALFSKEIAITLVPLLLVLEVACGETYTRVRTFLRRMMRLVPFAVLTVIYLVMRRYTTHIVGGYYGSSGLQFDLGFLAKQFIELLIHTIVPAFLRIPFMTLIAPYALAILILAIVISVGIGKFSSHKKQYAALVSLFGIVSLPFLQVMFHPLNDGNERYTYLLSSFFAILCVYVLFLLFEKRKHGTLTIFIILLSFFSFQIAYVFAKQQSWIVADTGVTQMMRSVEEADLNHAYVVFIGLPDNIHGAESMRNAIKEAIALETRQGYIEGERIPIYVAPDQDHALGPLVDMVKTGPFSYRFTASDAARERLFTGFPMVSSSIGVFQMEKPKFPEHSGTAITAEFHPATIEQYRREGKKVLIAYYTSGSLHFFPVE